jgi:hypothetical protein
MPSTGTVFRLAALAWVAIGLAQVLLAVVDPPPGVTTSSVLPTAAGGAVLFTAISAFLWLRPGRASATLGLLFSFPSILSVTWGSSFGWSLWFVVPEVLVLFAFALCAFALWRTMRTEAENPS